MWQAAHSEGSSVITEEHLKIGSADALLVFDNAVCEPICIWARYSYPDFPEGATSEDR